MAEKTSSSFEEPETGEYSTELLKREIESLKKEISSAKEDAQETKERINQTTTFMIFIAGAIIIAFFLAIVPIFLDYFQNNEQRYEKFLDKTLNFYSKSEMDSMISKQKEELLNFKNCIWYNGLAKCLK